jgi:hypothetical protein
VKFDLGYALTPGDPALRTPFIRTAQMVNMATIRKQTHCLISYLGLLSLASRIIAMISKPLLSKASSLHRIRFFLHTMHFHKHDFPHSPESSPDDTCHGGCVCSTCLTQIDHCTQLLCSDNWCISDTFSGVLDSPQHITSPCHAHL